jgi:hypothetical protein
MHINGVKNQLNHLCKTLKTESTKALSQCKPRWRQQSPTKTKGCQIEQKSLTTHLCRFNWTRPRTHFTYLHGNKINWCNSKKRHVPNCSRSIHWIQTIIGAQCRRRLSTRTMNYAKTLKSNCVNCTTNTPLQTDQSSHQNRAAHTCNQP